MKNMRSEFFTQKIQQLSDCLFHTIKAETQTEYFKALAHIDEDAFEKICEQIKRDWTEKRFPLIADFSARYRQQIAAAEHPINYASSDENMDECTRAFFDVLNEIKEWHDQGLQEYHHPSCKPMTLEDWHKAGRPRSWSAIYDHFMEGLYPNREHNFAGFCRQYLKTLQAARAQRNRRAA